MRETCVGVQMGYALRDIPRFHRFYAVGCDFESIEFWRVCA